jgi:spermidine synthase
MNPLLTLLFFCSGATALIYEIVWSKYLSLMFGSTVQAQTVVLAVFMGGLALGNRLFGQRADSLKSPVAVYGYLEIAIGVYALLFNFLYLAADKAFISAGASLLEQRNALLLLKGGLSVLLLLGPTILMGGTLPLLAAWLQKHSNDAGRTSARFYAINTLGAVAGACLAGFILVRYLGMTATLLSAGALNLAIGVAAIVIARRKVTIAPTPAKTAKAKPAPRQTSSAESIATAVPTTTTLACVLVFATGAISMGLEVLASRSLGMIFGGSLQAFATMLVAFIMGIGFGGMAIASLRKDKWIAPRTIVFLLLGAAALLAVFLVMAEQAALFYVRIRNSFSQENKYLWHQLTSGGISVVALGFPAALIGAVLPLWIRIHSKGSISLGNVVGRLLTWNTLGAVTGALATGFILMPNIGLRLSFGVLGALLCLAALLVAMKMKVRHGIPVSATAAVILLLLSMSGREQWQFALTSGIFRERKAELDNDYFLKIQQKSKLLFYKDGTDATVAVVTDRIPTKQSDIVLSINGKPDGSILGDLPTQSMLGHLPMLIKPDSKDVFVLGFGTGITSGALLGHPISTLTIAENCEPVLEAGQHFAKYNRGVLTNSLTKIYREDARTVLKLDPRKYDVIISEPSNPWTAAIGSVFSQQFYELAASRLKDDGIIAQWFHMYEMSDEIVDLVFRTFHSVFPSFEVWETRNGDLILLGSKQPWTGSTEAFKQVFARPQAKSDLEELGFRSPETIWARQLISQNTSFALITPGRVQTDSNPVLEYEAPRAFYEGSFAMNLMVFDERMLQSVFAPKEKQEALSGLSKSLLVGVFEKYGSANSPMLNYVNWRNQPGRLPHGDEVYDPEPFLEFIFRTPKSYPHNPRVATNASTTYAMFLTAEAIGFHPERWLEGVQKTESLLNNHDPNHWEDGKEEPNLAYFAAKAAKARFRHGDRIGALKTVKLGLGLVPDDVQLLFLKRLLERDSAPRG